VPDSVDAVAIRRWCATGLDALRRHQGEIDALNVYPVPDGDTGTNLVLTMTAAAEALDGALDGDASAGAGESALGAVLRRLARGALLGARGNSGIILSQLFRGLADALAAAPTADGRALAAALDRASRAAYAAVATPVEGTVLTVGAAAAKAAASAVGPAPGSAVGGAAGAVAADGAGIRSVDGAAAGRADSGTPAGCGAGVVARAAANGAREALARTPEQLPVLARAGVVDAGGRGLVVLLDALVEVLTGEPAPTGPVLPAGPRLPLTVAREAGSPEFGYEVQYLLDAPPERVDGLKARLGELGDSLVVVGSAPTWHVHVHVNDVGAAVEAGVDAGRPSRITVTRFADQMAERTPDRSGVAGEPARAEPDHDWADGPVERGGRGVVAVCTGARLAELFEAEGAVAVTGTPSTAELLAAIEATGAGRVVVLPNDPNVTAVANAAAAEARAAGLRAGVVPTRSPVQGLAALAVRDVDRRFEDDVIAMAEAAGACRSAELTIASREALTMAGRCQPGDVLGLIDGEVVLIGHDLVHTAHQLIDRMLTAGGELVTLVLGEGAPDGLGEALNGHVVERWRFVELQCYEGGQPHYPLLIGVE
jgi:DAK2 domain fusion protein YloV